MKKLTHKRNQKGFTIIEVLIVLAIAGLIMVVVFLAVPALQRNGRNNALSTDANNLLAGVSEYTSNNGGSLPTIVSNTAGATSSTWSTTTTNLAVFGAGNEVQVKLGGNITNLMSVTTGTLTSASRTVGSVVTPASPVGAAQLVTGANGTCNASGTGMGSAGAGSARSFAILYVGEGANGSRVLKCIGS